MKKEYMRPTIEVVTLNCESLLEGASKVFSLNPGGGGAEEDEGGTLGAKVNGDNALWDDAY